MRDAISGLIGRYDQLGRYFDRSAIDSIEDICRNRVFGFRPLS